MESTFPIGYRLRLFFACAIVISLSIAARQFHLDDALIYARYIANALHGHGLVYNPGEPVNALTSILNTWLALGLSWLLHGKVLLAQAILSGIFLCAAVMLAEAIVPLSGIFVASMSLFYYCIGMETSLFLFLLAATVFAYVKGHVNWLPILCTLAVLSRFEAAALIPILIWHLRKQRQRPALASFIPCLLLVAFYFLFNLHFYNTLLPQSATAKFGQGLSGNWGRWPTAFLRIPDVVFRPFGKSYFLALGFMILAGFGARDIRMKRENQVILPFLLILASFYILFNIPGYHWYYAPFLFFFILYAARLIPQARIFQWIAVGLALSIAMFAARDLHSNEHSATSYVNMAKWIDHNTPPNARFATVETGTVGWYSNRYIIDIVGLTTPANARYTAHRDFSSWLTEEPDYIIVHPARPFPWEKVALASPQYEYVPVHFDDVYLLRRRHAIANSSESSK